MQSEDTDKVREFIESSIQEAQNKGWTIVSGKTIGEDLCCCPLAAVAIANDHELLYDEDGDVDTDDIFIFAKHIIEKELSVEKFDDGSFISGFDYGPNPWDYILESKLGCLLREKYIVRREIG